MYTQRTLAKKTQTIELWNPGMISNHDLIIKTKQFLEHDLITPYTELVQSIIDFWHAYDTIRPLQHTILVQYCITCEWREEEYRRTQALSKHKRKNTNNIDSYNQARRNK